MHLMWTQGVTLPLEKKGLEQFESHTHHGTT